MKRVSWSVADGVSDGHEFLCRACCEVAISDQYMPDVVGDVVANWLSNVGDEGYRAVSVGVGVECSGCGKVVK